MQMLHFSRVLLLTAGLTVAINVQAQMRSIQWVHFSPDSALGVVDVWVDTVKLADSLPYLSATPVKLLSSSQSHVVAVCPAGSIDTNTAILRDTLMADTASQRCFLNGMITSTYPSFEPLSLTTAPLYTTVPPPGYTHCQFYNGSPDFGLGALFDPSTGLGLLASSLTFHEHLDNDTIIETLNHLLELRDSSNQVLRSYQFKLSSLGLADSSITIAISGFRDRPANFNGPGLAVHYIGLASGPVHTFAPAFAQVQWINNSTDSTLGRIDVFVNENQVIDNLAFRSASAANELLAGVTHEIGIAAYNSNGVSDTMLRETHAFEANKLYYLMVCGSSDQNAIYYQPLEQVRKTAKTSAPVGSQVSLLLFNGAPDLPSVDLNETGLLGATMFDNVNYGSFSAYENVAAATYKVSLTNHGLNQAISEYAPDLSDTGGNAVMWMISGIADTAINDSNLHIGIFELPPHGGAMKELAKITGLAEQSGPSVNVFPNPTSGELHLATRAVIESVQLMDMSGNIVQVWNGPVQQLKLNQPAGLYQVRVFTHSGQFATRIALIP